jgi:tetratricopeptide (TPR) repeat protein
MKKILVLSAIFAFFQPSVNAQTLDEAKVLTLNEQNEAASSMFKQLIAKFPMKGDYWFYYGENLLQSDNAEEKQQEMLDEAIDLSFPASDPPSTTGGVTRIDVPKSPATP